MALSIEKLKKLLKVTAIMVIAAGHILVFTNQSWFLSKIQSQAFSNIMHHATQDHQINVCPFSFPSFNIQWHNETFQSPAGGFVVSVWNFFGMIGTLMLLLIAFQFILLINDEQQIQFLQLIRKLLAPPRRTLALVEQ